VASPALAEKSDSISSKKARLRTQYLAGTLDQMARYSRALLPLLLLACALVQSSYGSRSSLLEPQKPEVLSPAVHGTAEPRPRGDGGTASMEEGATGRRGAHADGGAAHRDGRSVAEKVLRTAPSPKLARRVLRGGATADSTAGSSCRSHDARVSCAPPALH
jgi:hypothetical protein